jgi:hypothetical protein
MHEKLYNQDILVEEILGMSLKSINWSWASRDEVYELSKIKKFIHKFLFYALSNDLAINTCFPVMNILRLLFVINHLNNRFYNKIA